MPGSFFYFCKIIFIKYKLYIISIMLYKTNNIIFIIISNKSIINNTRPSSRITISSAILKFF